MKESTRESEGRRDRREKFSRRQKNVLDNLCKQVLRMGPALSNERFDATRCCIHACVCAPSPPPPPPSVLESFASCREEELIRRYFCQSNAARATRRIFPLNDKEIWSDVNLQLFLQRRNSKDPNERGRSFPLLSPIEELITGYTR